MKQAFIQTLKFLILTISITLLTSCITVSTQDRAPQKDIDVSKIPNAVPKTEPKSRYGNRAYSVYGKHYNVLNSNHGYSEVGIASWYGMKFHKEQTSSGEYYDLYQMTAAHRTLPIPSYVKVTNLKNGRVIIVKINDRGPFEKNRLIDLSYVAAKKLDILKKGTGLVKVEAIEPIESTTTTQLHKTLFSKKPLPTQELQPPTPKIYMQLGIYSDLKKAQAELQRAKQVTSLPVQLETISSAKQIQYRLKLGPFVDQEIARRFSEFMEHSGFTHFVIKESKKI